MSKKIKTILAIALLLFGLTIFIYPRVTNILYDEKVEKQEKEFEEVIKSIENNSDNNQKTDLISLYNLLQQENNKLFDERQETFLNQTVSYEKTLIDLTEYGLNENIIGFLEIPSIDVKLPIYLGASDQNMRYGAVHLTGTSYPIGGNSTNSVIAAHRGYYKSKMFRQIDKISLGDTLYIRNFNNNLEYKAVKIDIIKPNQLDKLTIQENKDMITIISCHPYPHNYQRYVVYFERKI